MNPTIDEDEFYNEIEELRFQAIADQDELLE